MSKKNDYLLNYEINEMKFFEALSKGITFKTNHKNLQSKQFGEKMHFEQTFQYDLYSDVFLNLNRLELLRLGIIKIKK
ncbi:MAG: hypothetical protein ACRCZO_04250 [Cetobacterium sp.]